MQFIVDDDAQDRKRYRDLMEGASARKRENDYSRDQDELKARGIGYWSTFVPVSVVLGGETRYGLFVRLKYYAHYGDHHIEVWLLGKSGRNMLHPLTTASSHIKGLPEDHPMVPKIYRAASRYFAKMAEEAAAKPEKNNGVAA